MTPSLALVDVIDGFPRHAIRHSYSDMMPSVGQFGANAEHVAFGQSAHIAHAFLDHGIPDIFAPRADCQMVGTDAGWIVAHVQNFHAGGDVHLVLEHPRESMGIDVPRAPTGINSGNAAIPITGHAPKEDPACLGLSRISLEPADGTANRDTALAHKDRLAPQGDNDGPEAT